MTISYPIEYSVIAAYLILMIVIGLLFRRFNRNSSDYFRGGSQATWWMVGVSSFMMGISALSFTGNGGAAFQAGWSVLILYGATFTGLVLQAVFLAPWFRQLRATTVPEVIRLRFDPATQKVYAGLTIVNSVVLESIWLLALAIFGSITLHLPIHWVVPCLGAVSVFYSALGGKWAVMAAGFLQGLILMGMTILLTVFCLIRLGGVSGFFQHIDAAHLSATFAMVKPAGAFPAGTYTWSWLAAAFAVQVIFNISAQNSVRYFAVKDGREARKAAVLGCVLIAGGMLFWFVPPITARLLYASEVMASGLAKPAEASFAVISLHLLPAGLLGMMIVAMFSATMCSMDAGLNVNAAIVVKDLAPGLLRRWRKPPLDDRKQMILGRIITAGFGLMIVGLADYFSRRQGLGIFEIMINFSAILGVPSAVPLVLCLFVRRVPPWSALAAIGASIIPGMLSLLDPLDWNFQRRTLWSVGVSAGVFLTSRLWWGRVSADYRAQVAEFFARMHRPVDYAAEVGAATDRRQSRVMGRFTTAVAVMVLALALIPNPLVGRLAIVALAAMLASVAILLLHSSGTKKTHERRRAANPV